MAAHCAVGPCVQVYTDPTTHQLIIRADQNRPGSTLQPHPVPKRTYKPRPKPTVKPIPKTWIPYKAVPIVHRTYKPRAKKKSTAAKVVTTALSLSDQITRLLPGSKILYQPARDAVTGVPVYFWSDTNPVFKVATAVLGISVNVTMNPSYVWNFGDGTTFSTSKAGGPYPDSTITHIYERGDLHRKFSDLVGWFMGGARRALAGVGRCDRAERIGHHSSFTWPHRFHTVKLCTSRC